MRIFALAILITATIPGFAQRDSLAMVKGNVIDFEQQARTGETILFEDLTTHETYTVVSDGFGKFEIGLPFDRSYLIKIQGFQFDQEYAQIDIPALQEGHSGFTFNVTIEFDPPQNVYPKQRAF